MLVWMAALAGILAIIVLCLCIYLHLIRKSLSEITSQLEEKLNTDTNTVISVSSRDSRVMALADMINVQLRTLRLRRQKYQQGDSELKQAVTNISHDLRTPLTAISGYLGLLEGEEKSPGAERYVAIIRERTGALKNLTEELFRFSVISSTSDELHLEAVSLNGALEESIAGLYAALTERGITPVIHIPEEPVCRRLDKAALLRIFGNLLGNALKYSGGDLTVTMTGGRIAFRNSAPGLDEVSAQRLFDRFYTVESGRGSTGLGLSIARLLTSQMGGSIWAQYEDVSLTVTVDFPETGEKALP